MSDKICWWCGNIADSGEHIFKKSDFKRAYGNPPYSKEFQPYIVNGPNRKKVVQGPNSDAGKFLRNLCKNCNNSRSSKYDLAYDKFIDDSKQYFHEIFKTGEIDLIKIFGTNWKDEFGNTLRYYVKHICCRLSNEGIEVPTNLINYLDQKEELLDARLQIEIRPLNKAFAEAAINENIPTFEILNTGKLTVVNKAIDGKLISQSFLSWITTDWLSVNYIVEEGVSMMKDSLVPENGKLRVSKGMEESPPGLGGIQSVANQGSYIEEYDRDWNQETLMRFYQRVVG